MRQGNTEKIQLSADVGADFAGQRLDQVAAELFSTYSRSRLQSWIKSGALTVDGKTAKPRDKLSGHEVLLLDAVLEREVDDAPEPMSLPVV